MTLSTPISQLTKIGKITANKFKKFGLEKAEDLLFYFPFRYDDLSQTSFINNLQANLITTIKASIKLISNKRSPIKKTIITEAMVSDQTGNIKIVWFNQPFLTTVLKPKDEVYFSGKIESALYGFQMTNPSYEKVSSWKKETIHTGRLVPIYSATENLTQKQIRFLIKFVLPLTKEIKDWLPEEIKKDLNFPNLADALHQIHFPDNKEKLEKAKERLKFDELFLIQISTQQSKKILEKNKAPKNNFFKEEIKNFVFSLPFKLTDAQKKSAWQILKDLQQDKPMNRLLEGEVGSGKTVVATMAMLNMFLNNYQSVLMVPTEILAQQHFNNICQLLANFNVKIGLITKSQKILNHELGIINNEKNVKSKKNDSLSIINNSNIIIGTHSLIQENIKFENLGLVIIDEQHRFGVEQRAKLCKMSNNQKIDGCQIFPHFLSMTATPIPRSLALALYGDLDLSIIDELPEQRKKIITKIVEQQNRQLAYNFIKNEIKKTRQIFVLCPLINESDKLGVKSAIAEYEKLKKNIFSDFKIGLMHGKLKTKEKEEVMQKFLKNEINILVSTSVIEVGIDVPNASIMMIEGAERFGLAQLYQFRGRVGRSEHQSYCFIFSETLGVKTKERLQALLTAKNSFELAEKDLEIRGPGQIYSLNNESSSARQSGYLSFLKIARLTDSLIIQNAKNWAKKILEQDLDLKNYPDLKNEIKKFEKIIHLE
ncbi:MAG: ATP-dependent DNA helicase RecG [Candidatus Kuenenbacteria bacterium]